MTDTTVYRWVKASERLPEKGGYYFVQIGPLKDKVLWPRQRLIEPPFGILDFEWLEEVPLSSLYPLQEAVEWCKKMEKESDDLGNNDGKESAIYFGKANAYYNCKLFLLSLLQREGDFGVSPNEQSQCYPDFEHTQFPGKKGSDIHSSDEEFSETFKAQSGPKTNSSNSNKQ